MKIIIGCLLLAVMWCSSQARASYKYNIHKIKGECDTVIREIPKDSKGKTSIYFDSDTQRMGLLGLADLYKNGYDSLEIRIWFDYSMAIEKHLAIITSADHKWNFRLLTYRTKMISTDGSEMITSQFVREIHPTMGWPRFINQLISYKIATLPNGPEGGMDGTTYNVEYVTRNSYRYYSYWSPETSEGSFWGSKNMVDISELIQKVCDFKINQK
jgi:hypothetical protein